MYGQFVFDVAVVALLGLHRRHPVARLLDLAGERHDRQELGLRLRERLAGADRGQVEALEERVHRVGRTTALGDGLDDRRGADAHVAGAEDAGPAGLERDGVRLQARLLRLDRTVVAGLVDPVEFRALADGQEHAVARDGELGAGRRFRATSARGIGLAQLHPDELDAGHGAGLVGDDPDRAGLEDGRDAFLDRLVDLAGRRHVLHVAAVDERDLGGALADRRPRAVHRGEAAADDDDALADVIRVGQAERGGPQVFEAIEALGGVLAGDAQLVRVVAADRDARPHRSRGWSGRRA